MKPAYLWGAGFWAPGFANAAAWLDGPRDSTVVQPPCTVLPSRQKRGTSLVTRLGAEVAAQAVNNAGVEPSDVHLVYGSALGEIRTAVDQLDMMASDDGRLSPARFKNSVHNAPVGLLSVAWANRRSATALAAGPATFAMCLLEALLQLDDQQRPVVVAVADEAPDDSLAPELEYEPLAVGFCLGPEARPGPGGVVTNFGRARAPLFPSAPLSPSGNPAAAALPLLRAMLRREPGLVPVERDEQLPYCISLQFD
jgi:hypothetical protein